MGIAKIFKKTAALAAAFVLAFSAQAMAANVWNGSTENLPAAVNNVITITTGAQLATFAQSVNDGTTYAGYTIRLGDDIDLNNISWTPIGRFFSYGNSNNRAFSGIFDGAGYSVTRLNVNIADTDDGQTAGLFGYIDFPETAARTASEAQNITAEEKAKTDASELALSGEAYERVISERKEFYETFGIAPETPQTRSVTPAPTGGIVKNLKVFGSVTNTGGQGAAGIVCWNDGLIENCYFKGTVTVKENGNRAYVGGICSLLGANTYVVNCAAEVEATAYGGSFSYAGGIAGYCYDMYTAYIVNCSVESDSAIDSYMDAGGIVGGFAANVYNCVSAADSVSVDGQIPNEAGYFVGGIIGAFGTATNCYWLQESASTQPGTSVGGGSDTSGIRTSIEQLPAGTVLLGKTQVYVGAETDVVRFVYPTNASASALSYVWSIDNSSIAEVNNGVVKGISAGTAIVSAVVSSSAWTQVANVSVTPEGQVTVNQ